MLRYAASRLIGALRFARGLKKSFDTPLRAYRGTSLRSWFQKKCFGTPLSGLSGHFASLVVSKKASVRRFALIGALRFARGFKKSAFVRRIAAYRGTSLRSWFQKKVPATYEDFDFFPQNTPGFET